MTEQRTVYVVTSGAYSEYSIDGVYDTLEAAQKAAESPIRYRSEYATAIDEWTLGTVDTSSKEIDARDGRRGVVLNDGVYRLGSTTLGKPVVHPHRRGVKESPHYFCEGEPEIWVDQRGYSVTVYALDRERGMKALNDRVAQLMAEAEGIA